MKTDRTSTPSASARAARARLGGLWLVVGIVLSTPAVLVSQLLFSGPESPNLPAGATRAARGGPAEMARAIPPTAAVLADVTGGTIEDRIALWLDLINQTGTPFISLSPAGLGVQLVMGEGVNLEAPGATQEVPGEDQPFVSSFIVNADHTNVTLTINNKTFIQETGVLDAYTVNCDADGSCDLTPTAPESDCTVVENANCGDEVQVRIYCDTEVGAEGGCSAELYAGLEDPVCTQGENGWSCPWSEPADFQCEQNSCTWDLGLTAQFCDESGCSNPDENIPLILDCERDGPTCTFEAPPTAADEILLDADARWTGVDSDEVVITWPAVTNAYHIYVSPKGSPTYVQVNCDSDGSCDSTRGDQVQISIDEQTDVVGPEWYVDIDDDVSVIVDVDETGYTEDEDCPVAENANCGNEIEVRIYCDAESAGEGWSCFADAGSDVDGTTCTLGEDGSCGQIEPNDFQCGQNSCTWNLGLPSQLCDGNACFSPGENAAPLTLDCRRSGPTCTFLFDSRSTSVSIDKLSSVGAESDGFAANANGTVVSTSEPIVRSNIWGTGGDLLTYDRVSRQTSSGRVFDRQETWFVKDGEEVKIDVTRRDDGTTWYRFPNYTVVEGDEWQGTYTVHNEEKVFDGSKIYRSINTVILDDWLAYGYLSVPWNPGVRQTGKIFFTLGREIIDDALRDLSADALLYLTDDGANTLVDGDGEKEYSIQRDPRGSGGVVVYYRWIGDAEEGADAPLTQSDYYGGWVVNGTEREHISITRLEDRSLAIDYRDGVRVVQNWASPSQVSVFEPLTRVIDGIGITNYPSGRIEIVDERDDGFFLYFGGTIEDGNIVVGQNYHDGDLDFIPPAALAAITNNGQLEFARTTISDGRVTGVEVFGSVTMENGQVTGVVWEGDPDNPPSAEWQSDHQRYVEEARAQWSANQGGNMSTDDTTPLTIDLGEGLATPLPSNVALNFSGNGNLGADAMTVQVINGGSRPVQFVGSPVFEPIETQQDIEEQQGRFDALMAEAQEKGISVVKSKISAYCLELLGLPPAINTLFKLASPELQQKFQPVSTILQAAKILREEEVFNYDGGQSDKEAYDNSITQWAVWAKIEDLDRQKFEEKFVEQTRNNFEAGKVDFTPAVETYVRELSEDRWDDIQKINNMVNEIKGVETTSLDRTPEHVGLFADPPGRERFAVAVGAGRFNGIPSLTTALRPISEKAAPRGTGAMAPFGNLYDLPVFVDQSLLTGNWWVR